MYVNALCISDDPGECMDDWCGKAFSSYGVSEMRASDGSVNFADIHTVGDVRQLPPSKRVALFDMICTECTIYRNPYRIMTQEQMQQLYANVLEGYDDEQAVKVYDCHI